MSSLDITKDQQPLDAESNSIISEEDSAFEDMTPAVRQQANRNNDLAEQFNFASQADI